MCQNDSFRSFESRGTGVRLIGFDMKACKVRRCVVSPAANELLSKCAPMCSELGGENAFCPSAGVWYEQPPTHPDWETPPKPPLSVFGQLVADVVQWECQSTVLPAWSTQPSIAPA